MPNQDGTGPFGNGRPGRGLGYCGRFGTTVRGGFGRFMGRGNRRGYRCCPGRGFGFQQGGWGWNPDYYERPAEDRELSSYSRADLEAQKNELRKQLDCLEKQLENNKDN